MTEPTPSTTADPDEPGRRSSPSGDGATTRAELHGRGRRRKERKERKEHSRFRWLLGPAIAILIVILLRTFVAEPFSIPSASMDQTLRVGDRVLVQKFSGADDLTRGDIIVFDGTRTFGRLTEPEQDLPHKVLGVITSVVSLGGSGTDYVKRIVGMPGDHVKCCTVDGRLSVNEVPVTEPYLYPGDHPSDMPFDVTVPAGKLWVMGDHRANSADSRAHMGGPGGGFIPVDDVIGKVWLRYWPMSRTGSVASAPQLASIPRKK